MNSSSLPSLSDLTSRLLTDDVLGAVLSGRAPSYVPALLPEHFPIYRDREIWRAMVELENEGKPIDILSVDQRLQHTTTLEPDINWQAYLMGISGACSAGCMLMLEANAGIMVDNWRRWKIAMEALDAGRWKEAQKLFESVKSQQPGYGEVEQLLQRAVSEQTIARRKPAPALAPEKPVEEKTLVGKKEAPSRRWIGRFP